MSVNYDRLFYFAWYCSLISYSVISSFCRAFFKSVAKSISEFISSVTSVLPRNTTMAVRPLWSREVLNYLEPTQSCRKTRKNNVKS